MSVLLLGGTAEARALATRLVAGGLDLVTSLAGSTEAPRLPAGAVRIGGFGGIDGLTNYLRVTGVEAVVDVTHPFAARMSSNAATACRLARVPLLRLLRPSWATRPDAAGWTWVSSPGEAAEAAAGFGEPILLAVGRQSMAEFAELAGRTVIARVVEAPPMALPAGWELIRARGPFSLDSERELLGGRHVRVLVSKDSGGATDAKLDAAGHLGVPVVMVRRPAALEGVPMIDSVAAAAEWVETRAYDEAP